MSLVRTGRASSELSVGLAVLGIATVLAFVSARDYAGSWNDGSRLATVESLVDQRTFVIDDSIFVHVLPDGVPYGGSQAMLLRQGTLDKLYIQGHFYSDKSPTPALVMAGVYQGWQTLTGIRAREHPAAFCFWMTFLFSGIPYVVAVWCVYRMGEPLGLPRRTRLALTASFALATVALTYARHVNNHILLLGIAAAIFLQLAWLVDASRRGETTWLRIAAVGLLTGIGYGVDLGAGPVLLMCVGATVAWRCRHIGAIALFIAAALPGLVVHHAVNYSIGGTFGPANANPDFFLYPGCPFTRETMTGQLRHSIGSFLLYAASLLFGKRGLVGHDLPLFLAIPALVSLLKKRGGELPEVLCAAFWSGGTWMAYALTSNNSSGLCCSVRWLVPLLAPAYFVLAAFLRRWPEYVADLLILSGWGTLLSAIMWYNGPWITHMVPFFWPIQAAALCSWLVWRHRSQSTTLAADAASPVFKRAA